jgi:hypothetical protein
MRKMPGSTNRFFSLLVVSEGEVEYKYLEDFRWEPFGNRKIEVRLEKPIEEATDEQTGGLW